MDDRQKLEAFGFEELDTLTKSITDIIANDYSPLEIYMMNGEVDDVFERNTTRILALLINANKYATKDQIRFVLKHYSNSILCMKQMLDKAAELDF